MKYKGFKVPKKYNYAATDANGEIWAYVAKPESGGSEWYSEGDSKCLGSVDWKTSLKCRK